MTSIRTTALSIIVLAALTACGGGGGGGGNTIREVPFTSFSALAPDQTAVMTGISQTATGNITVFGGGGFRVDTASLGGVDTDNSTARLTYNGSADLSAMSFSTPQSSASFGPGQIDCSSSPACVAVNDTTVGWTIDATKIGPLGWNYQSFGVWLSLLSTTSFQVGAMSAGAVTPGNAVPTSGPATFTGVSSGFYVNNNGVPHVLAADMTAIVDFGTPRSVAFNTTNTLIGDLNAGGAALPAPGLDLIGSFTFAPGSSQFSGPVHTFDTSVDGLTGNGSGRFYGPNAQEIGGVYGLVGNDGRPSRMIGAFGGRQ
jgi:hypothetical protein